MAKKIKVVKAKVSAQKPCRRSKGAALPYEVWCLDAEDGYYTEWDACPTRADARKASAEAPLGSHPVIVHIDIPTVLY